MNHNELFDPSGKLYPECVSPIFNALASVENERHDPNAHAIGSTARGLLMWTDATAKRFNVIRGDQTSEMAGMVKKLEADHHQILIAHDKVDPKLTIGAWEQGAGGVLDEDGNITNQKYVDRVVHFLAGE